MKIHLIQPAWGMGKRVQLYSGVPPVGLAYIAGSLLSAGHEVQVTDAILEGWNNIMPYGQLVARGLHNQSVVHRIVGQPDIIGISVMSTINWPLVIDLCQRLKLAFPHSCIVLGGEHPTALPEFCLLTSDADLVVMGEGEETIVEVAAALQHGDLSQLHRVAGIAFRDHGEVVQNPRRGRIQDIGAIPRPAWHLFDIDEYQRQGFLGASLATGRRSLPLVASRGCPYGCTFCTSANMWQKSWIPRDPVDIVDEIEYNIKTYNASDFFFYDLTAVIRREWAVAFCNEIIRRKLDIVWQVGSRLEQIDDDLAKLLWRSGLRWVLLAPESGSERTRKRIGKNMSSKDIDRGIRACVRAGIAVKVQVLSGFPDDTHQDAWDNLRFAVYLGRIGVDMIGAAIFSPYPGTVLFRQMIEDGSLVFDDRVLRFIVSNNDFDTPIATTRYMSPSAVKRYQLLTLLVFVLSRMTFHPVKLSAAVFRGLFQKTEQQAFEKYVKALVATLRHSLVSPVNGPPIPWPVIDYDRFTPNDRGTPRTPQTRHEP